MKLGVFTRYREYLKEKRRREQMARGNGEYLLNTFADLDLLNTVIQKVMDDSITATLITIDGTRLVIKKEHSDRKRVEWERD